MSVIIFALQVLLGPHIGIGDAHPNMMLIIVALWSLSLGSGAGVIAGFACGLLYDLMATTPFGVMTLVLSLIGFLMGLKQTNSFMDGWPYALITFAAFALATEVISSILIVVLGFETSIIHTILQRMLASSVYDIVVAFPFFVVIAKKHSHDSSSGLKGIRFR